MYSLPAWFQENTETTTQIPDKALPKGQQPGEGWFLLLMPLGIVIIFLFLFWLPQRRQERDRQNLLNQSKKGDKVVTTAGIYGTVVSVSEQKDEVTVEVDNNVRLKMMKSAIYRNFTVEEAAQQANKPSASPETKKS